MKNKSPLDSPSQIILGVLVIGLGLVFLLDNLGLISVRHTFRFWPTILIIFGLLKISQSRTRSGYVLGGVMVLLGVTWTFRAIGLFYISWNMLWPLVIIGIGIAVVTKSLPGARQRQRRRHFSPAEPSRPVPPVAPAAATMSGVSLDKDAPASSHAQSAAGAERDDDSIIEVSAILGGFVRRVSSQRFRGGDINVIMAGCEIDLRQSSIEGEAVLNVFALCGGITIKVPPDWSVILQGTPILGGFEEKTIVPPHQHKRLYVSGYAIMGGLEIRN
ncbi:LiaI-LiaF-like domain-containing protein [Janthinobacterium sp. RB2R34]|uniref:LiaI-LiaF-like domain-containing protein n=1 Tax=Janthinobacterium sp. RB2R34 TaxID=3424193 RepID=UPI003F2375AC